MTLRIKFLGTGGGRFVTAYQLRRTGGILIEIDEKRVHVDPGPGAVRALKDFGEDVRKLDVLLISHAHPDHVTDAAVVVEGMTWGTTKKRGILLAPDTVVSGYEGYRPVSPYHLSLLDGYFVVSPGKRIKVGSLTVEAINAVHTEPKTVGFVLKGRGRTVTYYSDTGYWEGMEDYAGDVVIFNLEVPQSTGYHTGIDTVKRVLERARPSVAILTHFGMRVLRTSPNKIAEELQRKYDLPVIAAKDGLEWKPSKQTTILDY